MKNLLKKWVAGGITWEEEKKLRQVAAKDEFLSEAMEGYDAFPDSDHSATIERLKGRLPNAQKRQEKGAIFTLPRVAAAAAMVGVVSTLFWVQNQIEQPTGISDNMEKIAAPAPLQNVQPTITETQIADNQIISKEKTISKKSKKADPSSKKSTQSKPKTPPTTKSKVVTPPTKTDLAELDNTTAAESEMADVQIAATTLAEEPPVLAESVDIVPLPDNQPVGEITASQPSAPAATARKQESEPSSAATSSFYAQAEQQTASQQKRSTNARSPQKEDTKKINFYVGQVQNEDGQPLHDVKVVVVNTPFKTASQYSGDFMLKTTEPVTEITVSKDGFHTRKILINQYSDFLNVSLVKKSTKIDADLETIAPKPQQGFVHLIEYLKNNLAYPAIAGRAGIEREVEVRFMIDKDGTPTDFKVVNPDQYGFDKEAIRLLKNGPKWEPTNSHARYFVSFELE